MEGLLIGSLCLVVVLGGGIGLVVWLVVHQSRVRQARVDTLASYAAKREWRFSPSGRGLEQRFRGDPFGRGHGRSATNVVEGWHDGRGFVAFDYVYRTSNHDSGDSSHPFSVVSMHLGQLAQPVPLLQVAPQGSVGRFFRSLVGSDFRLGDPPFDDAFHVKTLSPELAHDVLHADMRAMLSAYQDRAWRLQDDSLLMFRGGRHSAGEIDAVLASMAAILVRVPPHVWDRLRGEQGAR